MSYTKIPLLVVILCSVAACGSQIVEFPDDSGLHTDGGGDGSLDSVGNPGSDAVADAGTDAVDAGTDAMLDAGDSAGSDVASGADADTGSEGDAGTGVDGDASAGTDATVATAPTVVSTQPGKDAAGISVAATISATFSQALDAKTVSTATFVVTQDGTPVDGSVTYGAGTTATFTPAGPLDGDTVFVVTLTTGIQGETGLPLAAAFTWKFTTGTAPDTTAPFVTSTSPVADSKDVAVNSKITIMFSESMDPLTISATTLTVKQGSSAVSGVVTYGSGDTATFMPTSVLAGGSVITVTVSTSVKDLAGNAMADPFIASFTTGATPDTTAPTVSATSPIANAMGVAVNTKINVAFSEAMDPLTILAGATFTVKQGGVAALGTLAYGPGNTVTFTPASPLAGSLPYTVTLTTGVQDLAGNPLAAPYTWSFTTGAAPDTAAPMVTSTSPAANSSAVAVNTKITATFSEAMDPLSMTGSNVIVKQGSTTVKGTLAYGPGHNVTFTPSTALAGNQAYTVTITSGVKDLAGNPMANYFIWTFTTGAAPDTAAPTVSATSPIAGAPAAAVNTKVTITFSEPMDPLTLTTATVTVKQGGVVVAGTVVYGPGNTVTFTPTNPLPGGTTFTVTVTGAKDLAGNLLPPFTFTFTTGATPDATAPTVLSENPAADAIGVALDVGVTATFSEPMDALTLTTATLTMKEGLNIIAGTVTYGLGNTVKFNPNSILASNTLYTVTISTGAKDLAGNPLAKDFKWSFTTGIVPAKGPKPVLLGTAGNYVVLAKSAISSVPACKVTGDIAVSPAAATYLTGFSLVADSTNVFSTSPQIVGKAYAANYAVPTPTNLTTAVSNMEAAYTDAASRPTPDFLELGSGNIGGKTLAPGLYKWTSSITMPADVVLSGGANDVWIFQTTGDIGMAPNKQVILSGGARAKNVFWQVAGKGTFGAGSHFEGILLCKTEVTLQTGATMNGRILAQTLVALQKATVSQPAQ